MDNAPVHDEAVYDPQTHCLTTLDVGLNSLLALDAEMLSHMAKELGKPEDAAHYKQIAERTRSLVQETFWDNSRKIFANRLVSGEFVRSVAPTSFYPLLAGCATEAQIECMIAHLDDPAMFGGEHGIPSVSRSDPAYADNTYWRGRTWPPLNYLVWQALRRTGRFDRASQLARASVDLFRGAWDTRRLCPENFNSQTGEALDQPDTEGFYSWGALMPLMGTAECMDFSPWSGWSISFTGDDGALRQVETPLGVATLSSAGGKLRLELGGAVLFETTLRGRLENILWERSGIGITVPPCGDEGADIAFPGIAFSNVVLATLDGAAVDFAARGEGIAVGLPGCAEARRLCLYSRHE